MAPMLLGQGVGDEQPDPGGHQPEGCFNPEPGDDTGETGGDGERSTPPADRDGPDRVDDAGQESVGHATTVARNPTRW